MLLPVALVLPLLMGHDTGGCGGGDGVEFGPPTGSTCPPDSTLTWDSFGHEFMDSYCTRCHASTLTGADRQGAPLYHDFDTVQGVRNVANHVDYMAAAGPDAINTQMPIDDGATPTLGERKQLGEWLACGAP